jgi:uncharacterized membrane-anchored protein YitT (DUF2179 family)
VGIKTSNHYKEIGEFNLDKMHGICMILSSDGSYSGQIKNDLFEGYGTKKNNDI